MQELEKINNISLRVKEMAKGDIDNQIDLIVEDIATNGADMIELISVVSKMKYFLETLEIRTRGFLMSDLEKYDKAESLKNNVSLKIVKSPAKYDYSANKLWQLRSKDLLDVKEKLKSVEDFIKALKGKTQIHDEETGELIDFYPPAVSQSETVRISLK